MPHLHYNKYAAYQSLTGYFEIHPVQNFTGSALIVQAHKKGETTGSISW